MKLPSTINNNNNDNKSKHIVVRHQSLPPAAVVVSDTRNHNNINDIIQATMMGSNDQEETVLSNDHHDITQEESLLQPAATADVASPSAVDMNDKNGVHQRAGNNNDYNQSQVAILMSTTQANDDRGEQQQVLPSKEIIRIHKMNNYNSRNSSISTTTTNFVDPDCVFVELHKSVSVISRANKPPLTVAVYTPSSPFAATRFKRPAFAGNAPAVPTNAEPTLAYDARSTK
jgi:hypothetical protein